MKNEGGDTVTAAEAYKMFRDQGLSQREALQRSVAYWPEADRQHLRECMARTGERTPLPERCSVESNVEYVTGVVRDEEVKAFRVFEVMDRRLPAEIARRGLSPDTLGFLRATHGWYPEDVCEALGKMAYCREHASEIKSAIGRHSGRKP